MVWSKFAVVFAAISVVVYVPIMIWVTAVPLGPDTIVPLILDVVMLETEIVELVMVDALILEMVIADPLI